MSANNGGSGPVAGGHAPRVAAEALALGLEEARIRRAYATRRRHGTDDAAFFQPGDVLMAVQRELRVLELLRREGVHPLASRRILEIGCGSGSWLANLLRWGAQPDRLVGVDLLPGSLARARERLPAAVELRCANAAKLEFPDASFDLVMQFTVFTSVLDPAVRRRMAAEMLRVLRPEGLIVWYDFRYDNPRNPDVRGVSRREMRALFPGTRVVAKRITLAPPLARRLAPASTLLCQALEQLPLLCTHDLAAIRKPA